LIRKEAEMTSHDVVARLRHILKTKKIGHSGTLDPNATGVLLVLIGRACKVLPFLEDTDKEYIAELELGKQTLGDDIWSEVLAEKEITPIIDLQALLHTFLGKQKQLPPMLSSIKVNGKKLYEYARNKEAVEVPMRDVTFYELEVLDEESMRFRVACSSGTYIRSLCRDVAQASGNLGCMKSLVRTKVGRFSLADCVTLEDVEAGHFSLHSVVEVLAHLPQITYEPMKDIYNGKHVRLDCKEDRAVIMDHLEAVAIYERDHGNVFRCVRGLW